jgi:hypothetical protein
LERRPVDVPDQIVLVDQRAVPPRAFNKPFRATEIVSFCAVGGSTWAYAHPRCPRPQNYQRTERTVGHPGDPEVSGVAYRFREVIRTRRRAHWCGTCVEGGCPESGGE